MHGNLWKMEFVKLMFLKISLTLYWTIIWSDLNYSKSFGHLQNLSIQIRKRFIQPSILVQNQQREEGERQHTCRYTGWRTLIECWTFKQSISILTYSIHQLSLIPQAYHSRKHTSHLLYTQLRYQCWENWRTYMSLGHLKYTTQCIDLFTQYCHDGIFSSNRLNSWIVFIIALTFLVLSLFSSSSQFTSIITM